jgi:hypothetical protein
MLNIVRTTRSWTLALAICLATANQVYAADKHYSQAQIENVLGWLPQNTMCISVAQPPFTVRSLSLEDTAPNSVLQTWFLWPMLQGGNDSIVLKMHSTDILLCIDGQMEWRQNPGSDEIHEGHWEHSNFIFLRPDSSRDERIAKHIAGISSKSYKDHGVTIYEISWKKEDTSEKMGPLKYQVCMPKPGLLIFTTDNASLQHILMQMHAPERNTQSCLLMKSPEWNCVNQNEPYWGIRRYLASDVTSPSNNKNGFALDPGADGIAFEYSPARRAVTFKYLSTNTGIKKIAETFFCLDSLIDSTITIKKANPSVATTHIGDERSKKYNTALSVLFCWPSGFDLAKYIPMP